MKRAFLCLLGFAFILSTLCVPTVASEKAYSWYCVHEKEHRRPRIDPSLGFIEELDGYYIGPEKADGDKVIYLTFDAGYENGNVERILDVLKEESVTAAFFILGHLIEKNPDLVLRMAQEGHTVCNHTYHHRNMAKSDKEAFSAELSSLAKAYRDLTGTPMASYYRPPEGRFTRENLVWAKEMGYATVFWSFAYPDWDNQKQMSPEKAKQIVLDNVHDGEIMLLHPTSATNAAILRDVISVLREEGYRFGSLQELREKGRAEEGSLG